MRPLRGALWILVLYDVAEEIDLGKLREILGTEPPRRDPSFKHPAPEYVKFERPPVVQYLESVQMAGGEEFHGRIKYFEYGVMSVELERPFEADWEGLVRLSSRWIAGPDAEKCAAKLVREAMLRATPALGQPYAAWVSEEYYVIQLQDAPDEADGRASGAELLSAHGRELAQIIRGETTPLSEGEQNEALQPHLSYYPGDLMLAGWVAAFIYDTPEGAEPAIQLLEYANTQLLEFRHYDAVLTHVLANVYKILEHKAGLFRHWRMGRQAERLNTMRLDITELTERADNAIKFLSDMFYARAYRVAAGKIGVTDYRNLVEQKLRIAGELYEFMVNEFHQARAFVLEVMVVAILVIEVLHLFGR
jgi:hypothetical protein